jgi:hypothetical protein
MSYVGGSMWLILQKIGVLFLIVGLYFFKKKNFVAGVCMLLIGICFLFFSLDRV